jgi:hypothetical protein
VWVLKSESSLHNGGKLPDPRVAGKSYCLAKAVSHH